MGLLGSFQMSKLICVFGNHMLRIQLHIFDKSQR